MKTIKNLAWGVLAALALAPMLQTQITQAAPFGSAFTYQGRLNFSGSPAINGLYDFRFTLHDAATLGSPIGSAVPVNAVPVTNGLFTVPLDFLTTPFTSGEARWLQLQVNTNGITPLVTLNPRQRITPTPEALYAGSATTAATAATASSVAAGAVTSAGLAPGSVNGTAIADGSITTADLSSSLLSNTFWNLAGNIGTTPGGNFIGTADNQPLEFKVNNQRGLRLEPTADTDTVNVIGGSARNFVAPGMVGATIGGGGSGEYQGSPYSYTNQVGGNFGTVSGGAVNTILLNADFATVGGGGANVVQTNGAFATIPGGRENSAADYAFADGRRAKSNHTGAFVWADSQDTNFASTGSNQFLIRAAGGVGINKTNPATALDVNGTITATGFSGNGGGVTNVNATNLVGTISGARLSANVALRNGGNAFTGDQTIAGNVTATSFSGNGAGLSNVSAATLNGLTSGGFWKTNGNTGANPANGAFLGTTDNQPLELKVANERALRLEPGGLGVAPTLLGGYYANNAGVHYGVAIAGGGTSGAFNQAEGNYAFIGAGIGGRAGDSAMVGAGAHNRSLGMFSLVGSGVANTNHGLSSAIVAGNNNFVALGASNAFIGAGFNNQANGALSTIGGGYSNSILPNSSFGSIGGGQNNAISLNANHSFIGGGSFNLNTGGGAVIGGGFHNRAEHFDAVVAGGAFNVSAGYRSFIGGGQQNTTQTDASYATIGGGFDNRVTNHFATVPGGAGNTAGGQFSFAAGHDAKALHDGAFVWSDSPGGGFASTSSNQFLIRAAGNVGINKPNPATALDVNGTVTATGFSGPGAGLANVNAATLGGLSGSAFWKTGGNAVGATPGANVIGTTDNQAFEMKVNGIRGFMLQPGTGSPHVVGGGSSSVAAGLNGVTIGGGQEHNVSSSYSIIGGGLRNSIGSGGQDSTIGGGQVNVIANNTVAATVAGGTLNSIGAGSQYAAIGGGRFNLILDNGVQSTIGGGRNNQIDVNSMAATIAGGTTNFIGGNSFGATIGGGDDNQATGSYSTIGGGNINTSSGLQATVGGGDNNISSGDTATVGGGSLNTSSASRAAVGGGEQNTSSGSWATVGGGDLNTSSGRSSTVPGGELNTAGGSFSFAAGFRAKANHDGAFVWADSTVADFTSTANDQFCIRARGGIQIDPLTSQFFGSRTRQFINVYGAQYGIGVQSDTLYYRCDGSSGSQLGGFRWYRGGVHSDARGDAGGGTEMMSLTELGLYVRGTFVSVSDRNAKENFQPVDPRAVLAKVAALPLSEWSYKQDPKSRHIGPMAQDFYAAFQVGPDDKHITTVDESGVALAAIQGLNQKLDETRAENAVLKQRLEKLEQLMNRENGGAR